jgi:phosphoribosyl-AMP cyclohydrolase / phosphoribosyl-ATP pyrophosphohydrolase
MPEYALKYDENGLICAVAQDALSGDIRMVAWMNAEAVARTVETGLATFFSRSRKQLWTKGETSGNLLHVESIHVDCDGDTLLLRVRASGPSCHTGRSTCFFQQLDAEGVRETQLPAATFPETLERELIARQASNAQKSYTKSLLDRGVGAIGGKVREEASELVQALENESDERVVSEAADLLYHVMVGLRARALSWAQVIEVLASRSGQSGHAEKASRPKPDGAG